jgi:hypothetical protein
MAMLSEPLLDPGATTWATITGFLYLIQLKKIFGRIRTDFAYCEAKIIFKDPCGMNLNEQIIQIVETDGTLITKTASDYIVNIENNAALIIDEHGVHISPNNFSVHIRIYNPDYIS